MTISLETRVGQMLMGGFHGLTAPEYLLEWLREGRLGGVILFARNIESPAQVAELTAQLHEASALPLLIGIDQEGGTVARLREKFAESPGAMALASIRKDAEQTIEQVSAVLAKEMRALGINWTYAPVVDLTYNADNPTVGTRSFGSDQEHVAVLASAAVRGFQSERVAACAKHFPGLGDTAIDTHLALPTLETSLEHLKQKDLLPYRVLMQDHLATIMTTHSIFKALDPDHPATLSAHIVQKLIRDELRFNGVVTTDCMEMKAIDDNYGVAESVVRAANAGIDIILFSHTAEKQQQAYDYLLEAVKRGDVSEDIVNSANDRIARLKTQFPYQGVDASQVLTEEHQQIMLEAAKSSLTLLRTEPDVLPLRADDERKITLVEFSVGVDSIAQESAIDSQLVSYIKTHLPQIKTLILPTQPTSEHIELVQDQETDVLILATRNAHRNSMLSQAIQQMSQTNASVILLALRNPFDAGIIEHGTVICSAGDSTPSLQAVAKSLTGVVEFTGKLPVEVTS